MAPTRPSIMSDGAMMSQPASAWTRACRTRASSVASLRISPSSIKPVMAMAGIGIERHIAHDADLRHRRLDRPHRPAHQIVGVVGLAAIGGAQRRAVLGKRAMAGMPRSAASAAALTARSTDRRSTPGIEGTARGRFSPSMTKIGQIRSEAESVFAHQPARPVAGPVAAHADGGKARSRAIGSLWRPLVWPKPA